MKKKIAILGSTSSIGKSLLDIIKKDKTVRFKVYIDYPRQELIERINIRTSEMIEKGAIKEVKNFIKLRVKKDKTAYKAIGVNEIR